MGNVKATLAAVTLGVFAAGCSITQPNTANVADLDNVDFDADLKKETVCANYLFNFIGPFGDHSVPMAAEQAGFSKVKYVDYEYRNYVLLGQSCANVYGQ